MGITITEYNLVFNFIYVGDALNKLQVIKNSEHLAGINADELDQVITTLDRWRSSLNHQCKIIEEPVKDITSKPISELAVYEEAWTLPWALFSDHDRQLWIRGDYSAFSKNHGNATLRIYRSKVCILINGNNIDEAVYKYPSTNACVNHAKEHWQALPVGVTGD